MVIITSKTFELNTPVDMKYKEYSKYISRTNTVCFIHSCTFNNVHVLEELLDLIISSNAINVIDMIHIINIGSKIIKLGDRFDNYDHKINVFNYSYNKLTYELQTINFIHLFSLDYSNIKLLYLHTKGNSYNFVHQNIVDWKNLMLYFLIEKVHVCIKLLDHYDTVGINEHSGQNHHYSGNFWWANTNYIRKLNRIDTNIKHDAEFWLLSNKDVKLFTLYNSNVDHYIQSYPRHLYENINIDEKFKELKNNDNIEFAFYGIRHRFFDVKDIILKNFISDNKIVIPTDVIFNNFFGDPYFGAKKYLFIKVAKKYYAIIENNPDGIIVPLE
jgi:hypothetical protein